MSGYVTVLTWKSFSSRCDSFNLVTIARVICNRSDLVQDGVEGVGSCKFQGSKFEVRSGTSGSRLSLLPFHPPLSHPRASPNLRGWGWGEEDGEGEWTDGKGQSDILSCGFSYFHEVQSRDSNVELRLRVSIFEMGSWSSFPSSPLSTHFRTSVRVWLFFLLNGVFCDEDNIEFRTSNLDFDFRSKFEVLPDPGRSTWQRFVSVSSMRAVMMEDRVSLPRQTWTPPEKHLFPVVTDLGDSRSIYFSQHQNGWWKQSSLMITCRQRYFKFVEVQKYVEFTSWADEIVLGSCKQEINIFVIFLSSSESLRELTRWKKHDSSAHLGTGIFKCYVCDTICVHTHPCHTTWCVPDDCANVLIRILRILDNNIPKHCVIVLNVCVCLIICLIMINSHISFTLRHVLSVLLCDVSPYPLVCMTHCSSCVMCRFPYCLCSPYPEALDRYESILRFWTSTTLVNCPSESLSDHVVCFRTCEACTSPLSPQSFFAPFFRLTLHVLLTYLSQPGKSQKAANFNYHRKKVMTVHKRKRKDGARPNHAPCGGQRILFMRRRVRRPMLKRTRHIFWPTHAFNSASNGGTQNWHNSSSARGSQICSTVQCGFRSTLQMLDTSSSSECEKWLSRCFHKPFPKTVPEGKYWQHEHQHLLHHPLQNSVLPRKPRQSKSDSANILPIRSWPTFWQPAHQHLLHRLRLFRS